MSKDHHHLRKHSPFSASGADRWTKCPGSVALSEGLPDKSSPWALEGTRAHEVLESVMVDMLLGHQHDVETYYDLPREMVAYAKEAAKFVFTRARALSSEVLVEQRLPLPFLHEEMFGTLDLAIPEHFGTLHVFDYKYGAGHLVTPKENLQMIVYGLALAHKYDWNFEKVRLWIIQPRVKGYNGPLFWEITIDQLIGYVDFFLEAIRRVEREPKNYIEGGHCHWCKAKSICPIKRNKKDEEAKIIFQHNEISEYEKRR